MTRPKTFRRLDLLEMRRQLVRVRNQHSNDRIVVRRINRFLCRIYHLDEVLDSKQDQQIRNALQVALRDTEAGSAHSIN